MPRESHTGTPPSEMEVGESLVRALGWAGFFGIAILDHGLSGDSRNVDTGEATLRRVIRDSEAGG